MISRRGVCGLVFTPDQKQVVLTQRADVRCWYFPGGGIEPDETEEEAVVREVGEETGLIMEITSLQGVYDFRFPRKHPFFSDKQHVYCGVVAGGEITSSDESRIVRYFPVEKIPRGVPYWQKQYLQDWKNQKPEHVDQSFELFPALGTLFSNPYVFLGIPGLIRKLTQSS